MKIFTILFILTINVFIVFSEELARRRTYRDSSSSSSSKPNENKGRDNRKRALEMLNMYCHNLNNCSTIYNHTCYSHRCKAALNGACNVDDDCLNTEFKVYDLVCKGQDKEGKICIPNSQRSTSSNSSSSSTRRK